MVNSKHDLPHDVQQLATARPSTALDDRVRTTRDLAIEQRSSAPPYFMGKAAIFGLACVAAGFGIGFIVARGLVPDQPPPVLPEVQVRLVLAREVQSTMFDYSQTDESIFGEAFNSGETPRGDQ